MDELALLRDFRLEDAAVDGAREHARVALQRAMTRRRLTQRRYVVAIAFALAAVLAAAAYAIVHQFVIGSAAPKDVQDQIGLRLAVMGGTNIWGPGTPYKLVEPARIAAGTHTPAGPVYMLLGRVEGGGECQFVWYSAKRTPNGMPITSGACGIGKQRHPRGFGYAYEYDGSSREHPYQLIEGYAPGAVRIRIGKRFFKTPYGWFIALYRGPSVLTAYGIHGGVVAHVRVETPAQHAVVPPPPKPVAQVTPTGRPRVFVSTRMGWVQSHIHVTLAGRSFKWLYTRQPLRVSVSPNNKGGACIYVHVDPRRLDEPRCTASLRPKELEAYPTPVGWTSSRHGPSWVEGEAIHGAAGADISRVDVRFSDGSSARAPFRDGAFFYLVQRPNYAVRHRPVEIVGRDARGHIVARSRLPFNG